MQMAHSPEVLNCPQSHSRDLHQIKPVSQYKKIINLTQWSGTVSPEPTVYRITEEATPGPIFKHLGSYLSCSSRLVKETQHCLNQEAASFRCLCPSIWKPKPHDKNEKDSLELFMHIHSLPADLGQFAVTILSLPKHFPSYPFRQSLALHGKTVSYQNIRKDK